MFTIFKPGARFRRMNQLSCSKLATFTSITLNTHTPSRRLPLLNFVRYEFGLSPPRRETPATR